MRLHSRSQNGDTKGCSLVWENPGKASGWIRDVKPAEDSEEDCLGERPVQAREGSEKRLVS